MLRITIKKGTKWLQLFKLAEVFLKSLKLTKYDAMRLAYTTQSHDVLIQGSDKDLVLWTLQVKLRKMGIDARIEELTDFKVQVDLTTYEPQRMGCPYRGKKLWETKTNFLIFRERLCMDTTRGK